MTENNPSATSFFGLYAGHAGKLIVMGIILTATGIGDIFFEPLLDTQGDATLAGIVPGGSLGQVIVDCFLLLMGFSCLLGGAELLVRGASKVALFFGISPLVVGLTVVAFGTSSPEGAVSIFSAFSEASGIAVGNIIGSNIMNILIVIGLSAAVMPMIVSEQVIQQQVPLVIAASVMFFLMALDGTIGRLDGIIMFSAILIYTVWAIRKSRREQKQVQDTYNEALSVPETTNKGKTLLLYGLMTMGGILILVGGARMLVEGGSDIAEMLGVSDLVIGLTIVALGTSLPELATSAVAAIKKRRDIAVGNIIGSNLFNILAVIGLSGAIAPSGIEVSESALQFDIPVMTAAAIACLPIFFTGHRISRWEGFLLLGYYGLYLTYVIMSARKGAPPDVFEVVILFFVMPLTVVAIGISVYRHLRPACVDGNRG